MKTKLFPPTPQKCKGYFAVPARENVKSILPEVCPPTIDKRDTKSIMKLSIRWIWYKSTPGSGGHDGQIDAMRHQKRLLTPASQPESASRTGPRSALSDPSILRPTRSGSSEIRNAASGQPGTGAGYYGSVAIWLFAGDVLSGRAQFYDKRVARTATAAQRTASGIQTIRNCSAIAAADLARRPHFAERGLATTFTARLRAFRSSSQYRASAYPSAKKSLSVPAALLTPVRSPAILLQDYENLRCQALQANDPSLERLLLENQGMAVWMQFVPEHTPVFLEQSKPLSPDLVRLLTNLVIGSRGEVQHE